MTSKSQHAKLLSSIKDAVQNSTDDQNVSFIVGSLLLFEQCYAAQNKENFRKILNETLAAFGPGTKFEGDDRVIPLYILLGKYSRSSTHAEIFDRLNETGAYRKSAMFYVEWSRIFYQAGHSSRAKEIVYEGVKRSAKPESLLQSAIEEMKLESAATSSTPGRALSVPYVSAATSGKKQSSARKQLFPKKKPIQIPHKFEDDFVLPLEPEPLRLLSNSEPLTLIPLSIEEEERLEDAENVRPAGLSEETYVKRKTIGVLVPAAGFVLEDYDLSKVYEDEEKAEANRVNIENNVIPSPGRRAPSYSPTSSGYNPAARALFQPVNPPIVSQPSQPRALFQPGPPLSSTDPVLPPTFPESRTNSSDNEFVCGIEAFKNLRHESDEEANVDDRRLTGFEKMLLKRKSLVNKTAPKSQPDPLDVLLSKMHVSTPSTSKK